MLKALGASHRFIAWVFLQESLLISLCGIVGGLLLAYLVRSVLSLGDGVPIDLELRAILRVSAGGLACALAGALAPVWRAAGLAAVEALSYE